MLRIAYGASAAIVPSFALGGCFHRFRLGPGGPPATAGDHLRAVRGIEAENRVGPLDEFQLLGMLSFSLGGVTVKVGYEAVLYGHKFGHGAESPFWRYESTHAEVVHRLLSAPPVGRRKRRPVDGSTRPSCSATALKALTPGPASTPARSARFVSGVRVSQGRRAVVQHCTAPPAGRRPAPDHRASTVDTQCGSTSSPPTWPNPGRLGNVRRGPWPAGVESMSRIRSVSNSSKSSAFGVPIPSSYFASTR